MKLGPNYRSLSITVVLTIKTGEVEDKNLDHAKYITTKGFNELAVETFAARLKQAYLVSKIDFDNKLIRFKGSTT